jgi:hypothetical protein
LDIAETTVPFKVKLHRVTLYVAAAANTFSKFRRSTTLLKLKHTTSLPISIVLPLADYRPTLFPVKNAIMLYEGQTVRTLRERLDNQRSNIKLLLQTSISIHFNLPTHSISDLIITPILDILPLSEVERNKIEFEYMKLLNTQFPEASIITL